MHPTHIADLRDDAVKLWEDNQRLRPLNAALTAERDRYRDTVLSIGALLDDAAETGEDPERTVERVTDLVLRVQL